MRGHLGDRADLGDPPCFENRHPIREGIRIDGIMRHQQTHPPEGVQVLTQAATNVLPGPGVERRKWFVEQQDRRVGHQRSGQRDALRLPARELTGTERRVLGKADTLQPVGGSGPCLGPADAPRPQTERDVVERAQMGEEQVVLEDDADRAPVRGHEGVGARVVEHAGRRR